MPVDKPRGRPGTRRKWEPERDYVIQSGGLIDVRRDKSKPFILDLSGMKLPTSSYVPFEIGRAWAERQDWAGPSMTLADETEYRFGKG